MLYAASVKKMSILGLAGWQTRKMSNVNHIMAAYRVSVNGCSKVIKIGGLG